MLTWAVNFDEDWILYQVNRGHVSFNLTHMRNLALRAKLSCECGEITNVPNN